MLLYREMNGELVEAICEGASPFTGSIRAELPHLRRPGHSYLVDSSPSSFIATDGANDLPNVPPALAAQVAAYW